MATWTSPTINSYPPFIGVKRTEKGIEIYFRGDEPRDCYGCGQGGSLVMTEAEWAAFLKEANEV